MTLTRPAANDTLASPALDQVLDEYATAIEAVQATTVTRRVTAALSGAMSGTGKTFTTNDLNMRGVFAFPVQATRFRIKLRNYSRLNNTAGTGTATVTAYHGLPLAVVAGTGNPWRWTGSFASTPTAITFASASSTTMTDDNELTSDWVTNTYAAGETFVLSFGFANIASSWVAAGKDSVGMLSREASGAAAAANSTSTFSANGNYGYCDIRVEYEYETLEYANGAVANPVVLFIGDSITAGHVQSDFSSSGPQNFRPDTFPDQVGLRRGYAIMNAGVGQSRIRQSPISGTTSGWDQVTSTSHIFLERFDWTTLPDAAVVMLGTNDCGAATLQTFANIVSSYSTIITNLRSIGIDRVFICTIPPGGYGFPLTLTGSASSGATTITGLSSTRLLTAGLPITGTSIATGATIDAILSDTSVEMSAATTGTISSGSITFGSSSPDLTTSAAETLRQQLNAWIRTRPNNVSGVFDVAKALEGPLPGTADGQWLPYYPHPHVRGFARIADAIRL
jgi:hypothetical protein